MPLPSRPTPPAGIAHRHPRLQLNWPSAPTRCEHRHPMSTHHWWPTPPPSTLRCPLHRLTRRLTRQTPPPAETRAPPPSTPRSAARSTQSTPRAAASPATPSRRSPDASVAEPPHLRAASSGDHAPTHPRRRTWLTPPQTSSNPPHSRAQGACAPPPQPPAASNACRASDLLVVRFITANPRSHYDEPSSQHARRNTPSAPPHILPPPRTVKLVIGAADADDLLRALTGTLDGSAREAVVVTAAEHTQAAERASARASRVPYVAAPHARWRKSFRWQRRCR